MYKRQALSFASTMVLQLSDKSISSARAVFISDSKSEVSNSSSFCTLKSASGHTPVIFPMESAKRVVYLITAGIICLPAMLVIDLASILITLAYASYSTSALDFSSALVNTRCV